MALTKKHLPKNKRMGMDNKASLTDDMIDGKTGIC